MKNKTRSDDSNFLYTFLYIYLYSAYLCMSVYLYMSNYAIKHI